MSGAAPGAAFPQNADASPALAKGYCATIRRAMARDPANRLPRAGDLIAELRYLAELENRDAQMG
ncbi:MAG: hypothetical protein HYV63_32180 [Candidatus Schekmanbacteria bacterium]|nr:hypothetical protein [Candidatus Schekmanbacteria bacterium]